MSAATAIAQFVAAGLIALLFVSAATVWAVHDYATREAILDARIITAGQGSATMAPVLNDAVAAGDPVALAAVDSRVRAMVLNDRIVRVKLWDGDGRVVYSDAGDIVGQQFELEKEARHVLGTGGSYADVSDLTRPENRNERRFGKLLEVYQGVRTSGGRALLFEAYLRYDSVKANEQRVLTSLAPALIGSLLVLFLLEVPLAWSLASRIREGHQARARLAERALTAAERERHRIAGDLHDQLVQRIAGTAFSLAGAASRLDKPGQEHEAATVRTAAAQLRQGVRDLRTMIVAMAPPRLHDEGLEAAFEDLVSPLRAQGMDAEIDVEKLALPSETEALLFRVAQEAVRNVARHAGASRVAIRLTSASDGVALEVVDDGRGFDPGYAAVAGGDGDAHLGIYLLREIARDAGSTLTITSAPGQGTTVRLVVPPG